MPRTPAVRLVLAVVALLALYCPASSASQHAPTQLPDSVLAVLAKHKLPPESLSVYVQDVYESEPLLSANATTPRNPASVMKMITTLVALNTMGPAYRFFTDVYADTEPKDGVLEGNLYLRGKGDPYLATESFWRLLKDLRESGIERITGDLIVDSSYFRVPRTSRGAFDGRPTRAYNVGPDATLVNFFATRFKFFPDADANAVRIVADPALSNLTIDNQMTLTDRKCRAPLRKLKLAVKRKGNTPVVEFSGSMSGRCAQQQLLRSVVEPVPFVWGMFHAMWTEMGGRIDGKGRAGARPQDAVRLQRSPSRPLGELIRYMNKYSNNVMTRNLLLGLGAHTFGPPGTLDKGRRAVSEWLLLNDISAPELYVDNGSGLSRKARVSALSLARILIANWRSPYMPEFIASLPLSAMDGTLRRRFRGTELEGRVHMKTGLLNGTRSIAGYLQTASGRRLVLVALQNHKGIQHRVGTHVQDVLIQWAYQTW